MDLARLIGPETRIVDAGPAGPATALWLADRGHDRYLGLVAAAHLAEVHDRAGRLANRFHALGSASQILQNNADVLILRRPFVRCLWAVQDLRHVTYVAVEAGSGPADVEQRLAQMAGRLAGKMTRQGACVCGDERFEVVALPGRRPLKPRHYLSETLGVEGFARLLNEADVHYAVLRWFESLPMMAPGEDLDMLVADRDLATVQRILASEPGTIPVDLYSVTGLPGADYQTAAYYPPALAQQVLDRAVVHASGVKVPSPDDHLRSLAYHAAYHKGARSGLRSTAVGERYEDPEHDYLTALRQLAQASGVRLGDSLEEVDDYLGREGWRPPHDTLVRLSASNPWVRSRYVAGDGSGSRSPGTPEPAVFFVRERTAEVVPVSEILDLLDHLGFEVLTAQELDGPARERCRTDTRGGNWSQGPFAQSGGGPSSVIVALHHAPRRPRSSVRAKYPRLTNDDVLEAKKRVRDLVNVRLEPAQRFNPLHSSDSESEAWDYVSLALPERVEALRAEVRARRALGRSDVTVVKQLSRGRRARVEVVESAGGPVVRKTFTPTSLRHMEREVWAMRELGSRVDAVPALLETGPDWFSTPLYDNRLSRYTPGRNLYPLRVVRQMVDVLRRIHDEGFDLLDAKPDNFVLDPEHGLKVVDFEFLHRYEGTPPDFASSFCFVGVPEGFVGDVPVSGSTYDYRWRRFTGLSHDALLDSPPWSQHLQRVRFRASKAFTSPRGPVGRAVRLSVARVRPLRRAVARRYVRWAGQRARSVTEF